MGSGHGGVCALLSLGIVPWGPMGRLWCPDTQLGWAFKTFSAQFLCSVKSESVLWQRTAMQRPGI